MGFGPIAIGCPLATDDIDHIVLVLENLTEGINVLCTTMRKTVEDEVRGLATGVAEYVLASYHTRDPNFTLELEQFAAV